MHVAIAGGVAALLFALRGFRQWGGDSDFAESIAAQKFQTFYLRSPLTVYLHQAAYHFLFEPLGRSTAEAVGFCSAVAGGVFVSTLVALSRHPLFLLFNLAAPFLFIFMGHVEHYAWVNAVLAIYFLAVRRHLERGAPLWAAELWLLAAASFHMLAVFFAPTLLFLLAGRDPLRGRWRWRTPRREREILLAIFVAWALVVSCAQLTLHVGGLDNGLSRLVPLRMPESESRYSFTLFSWDHLRMWLYFHARSTPAGLAGLLLLGWLIRGKFQQCLLVAVACGFLWTWMWHPDRGRNDWDLFANLALPLNILVGLVLAEAFARRKQKENQISKNDYEEARKLGG